MRISDWSSDVCSSDLSQGACRGAKALADRVRIAHVCQGLAQPGLFQERKNLTVETFDTVKIIHPGEEYPVQSCLRQHLQPRGDMICGAHNRKSAGSRGKTVRSEERRVGTERGSPCRSRWSPYH